MEQRHLESAGPPTGPARAPVSYAIILAVSAFLSVTFSAYAEDQTIVVELAKNGQTRWVVPADGGMVSPSGRLDAPIYNGPICGRAASGTEVAGLQLVMWASRNHPGWAISSWRCMEKFDVDSFIRKALGAEP